MKKLINEDGLNCDEFAALLTSVANDLHAVANKLSAEGWGFDWEPDWSTYTLDAQAAVYELYRDDNRTGTTDEADRGRPSSNSTARYDDAQPAVVYPPWDGGPENPRQTKACTSCGAAANTSCAPGCVVGHVEGGPCGCDDCMGMPAGPTA